jgi:hypothetical protein
MLGNMKLGCLLAALALLVGAAEPKLKLADLPPPVQKTVQAQTKNAQLKGLSKEVENGETVYEIETMANGKIARLAGGSQRTNRGA